MAFLHLYFYFIVISFLLSLRVYFIPGMANSYLRLFPPFLLVTLIAEFLASYMSSINKNNMSVYNVFTGFEFCFYLWIIRLVIHSNRMKKIIFIILPLYGLTALINIIFIQKMKIFHSVTYSLGCLIIVLFCMYYFFELFRLPHSVNLKNDPAFWICSGLLFFYCCSFPLFGLINYWNHISKLLVNNFGSFVIILNIFLYSLFSIAFICTKTRKYTLLPS
jgi:hypothetical protein